MTTQTDVEAKLLTARATVAEQIGILSEEAATVRLLETQVVNANVDASQESRRREDLKSLRFRIVVLTELLRIQRGILRTQSQFSATLRDEPGKQISWTAFTREMCWLVERREFLFEALSEVMDAD